MNQKITRDTGWIQCKIGQGVTGIYWRVTPVTHPNLLTHLTHDPLTHCQLCFTKLHFLSLYTESSNAVKVRWCVLHNIYALIIMPRPIGGGIKQWCYLTSVYLSVCLFVCLSVAYIGTKSTTERPRKTKIGTEVAHVTRDSDTTFKVKRPKVKVTGAGAYCGRSRTACYAPAPNRRGH